MPNLKKRHHYVPQFWIRAFRDSKNRLYCREGDAVDLVPAREVMKEDWLYTLFNQCWEPSDDLENALSRIERAVAPIFKALNNPHHRASSDERTHLCEFLGLQACRHPDILKSGIRKARDFADVLARANEFSLSEFIERTKKGMNAIDATICYDFLRSRPPEELRLQLEEVRSASPQDSRLPMQDALRAYPLVSSLISKMQLILLDARRDALTS